jgi:hypothetical protein
MVEKTAVVTGAGSGIDVTDAAAVQDLVDHVVERAGHRSF